MQTEFERLVKLPDYIETGEVFETKLLLLIRDFKMRNPGTIETSVRCDEAIIEMFDHMAATGDETNLVVPPETLADKHDRDSVRKWRVHMFCASKDRVILSKFLEEAEALASEYGADEEYTHPSGERIKDVVDSEGVSEYVSNPVYTFYPRKIGKI